MHLLSALRRLGAGCFADGSAAGRWATGQRLVLGQEAVTGKPNELLAIPLLLERLALGGALVTIDAIGTQRAIAEAIRARGGDYLLALKANRPALLAEDAAPFADPPPGRSCAMRPWERIVAGWKPGATRCATTWPGSPPTAPLPRRARSRAWRCSARQLRCHLSEGAGRRPNGRGRDQARRQARAQAALLSFLRRAQPCAFARAVRGHWGIENRLHWVLGVVSREGLARLRTGHGPENMAVARHMAMNLLREAKPATSLKNRRKLAG